VPSLGVSFASWRATRLGLAPRATFRQVLDLPLDPIRLSASWLEIDAQGFEDLDWMLAQCEARGRRVILTVGMKAQGWPEFFLPTRLKVDTPPGGNLARAAAIRSGALGVVRDVVDRYRRSPAIVAWQVENEPFNRSGPYSWWLDRPFVRLEAEAVRRRDRRPILLTTFGPFNLVIDDHSSRHHGGPRRAWHLPAAREALAILRAGDILGLDVYRAIGRRDGELTWVQRADVRTQTEALRRWLRIVAEQGKQAWITEAQAEPWEAPGGDLAVPRTVSPEDLEPLRQSLHAIGFEVVLLWGIEYQLWRAAAGDHSWLEAWRVSR
jgi:hypothetical protein